MTTPASEVDEATSPAPMKPSFTQHTWLMITGLVLITLAAYSPVLSAGFVWDDDAHITRPALRSLEGLRRIWFEPGSTQQYYPLLHTAFWLEHHLWGDSPLAYHLASLTLHVIAAVLLGRLLVRLSIPGAWVAAGIFALHPVHVESVAWISEQKNTLSAVFALGAALTWLRFHETRQIRYYALASTLFLAALLSKSVTATLPAALLVLVWWRPGRISLSRDLVPMLPWLAVGIAAGLHTTWFERHFIGADGAPYDLALLQRLLLAPRIILFYVGKLLWPGDLIFIYPRWEIDPASLRAWVPLVLVLASVVIAFSLRRRTRAPLAAWLLYAGTLFPALGFIDVYPFVYSYVADHFQYLASIAVISAGAAVVFTLLRRHAYFVMAAAVVLFLILGALTWRQSRTYRDLETLFRTTIARNPGCWMAYNNLGRHLLTTPTGRSEAIACFESAINLRPDYFGAHNNLGLALTQDGRPAEAVPHLRTAAALRPDSHEAQNNLGIALATSGRAGEAVQAFAEAARLNPHLPNIQENWAKALILLGRREEAALHMAEAARLRALPQK